GDWLTLAPLGSVAVRTSPGTFAPHLVAVALESAVQTLRSRGPGRGWATLDGDAPSIPLQGGSPRAQGAGRQPGRDRRAGAAGLPGTRPGGGGSLLRRRPRRPPPRRGRPCRAQSRGGR